MKLCKDCKHYIEPVSADGGSLLPGFFMHIPAQCEASRFDTGVDLVSGEKRSYTRECKDMRSRGCGADGGLFVPANLDGRLAMLDEKR